MVARRARALGGALGRGGRVGAGGDRLLDPTTLSQERTWWFLQDRVVLRETRMLSPGVHDVSVAFRLVIPYLQVGPDGPLTLPFHIDRSLVLDAPASLPSVSRDVA